MAEAPENQRAALVERIAGLIERETGVKDDATADEAAEAVLSLLESGRAGVWLVPAVGVLDTVGVVIRQLRDAKTELVEARAEIERLRMACATQSHGVEQILGKALRYPAYGPEMFPDGVPDGSVCVGDHVPESLAEEAADLIERLREALFPDGWPCPNPDDPEGCYCPGDGPCLAANSAGGAGSSPATRQED